MEITHSITSEQALPKKYKNEISRFWQTGTFSSFQGVDDIRINFVTFCQANNNKNLIIVPGRSESYIKYQELSYDLAQHGYNIFILDHRGQGLSERMLDNPHKGYVNNFEDYAADLNTFINTYVLPHCLAEKKPYLLAHSMGCAIACLYLAEHADKIQAVVLSSPMFAINTGKISPQIANGLISFTSKIEKIFANRACYFPGQKNHAFKAFEDNKLSHSKTRYQIFKELYQKEKSVQLGGVTTQWLKQAHQIKDKIFNQLDKLSTPISVMQAGGDSIVDNQAQDEFCQQLHQQQPQKCPADKPLIIDGAWHELFFEQDEYRQPAIEHCLAWFNQHSQ